MTKKQSKLKTIVLILVLPLAGWLVYQRILRLISPEFWMTFVKFCCLPMCGVFILLAILSFLLQGTKVHQ